MTCSNICRKYSFTWGFSSLEGVNSAEHISPGDTFCWASFLLSVNIKLFGMMLHHISFADNLFCFQDNVFC